MALTMAGKCKKCGKNYSYTAYDIVVGKDPKEYSYCPDCIIAEEKRLEKNLNPSRDFEGPKDNYCIKCQKAVRIEMIKRFQQILDYHLHWGNVQQELEDELEENK